MEKKDFWIRVIQKVCWEARARRLCGSVYRKLFMKLGYNLVILVLPVIKIECLAEARDQPLLQGPPSSMTSFTVGPTEIILLCTNGSWEGMAVNSMGSAVRLEYDTVSITLPEESL